MTTAERRADEAPARAREEPAITPALVAAHGLKPEEWARFRALVGREPSFTELGIVSAMWNEHCSYKSSKVHLRTLPTTGPRVVHGPGENAGVVDIGEGLVAVFKMESHNHPSFIEPTQGAATGVGGILRDVFTMGARPVACLNALWFGAPSHPRTRRLLAGVVAGVGGYGNSFGVPTVGGSLGFHPRYDGNPLVNAMAVGIARADGIFLSEAKGVGLPIVYLGSRTGRDGIHGATMASQEFGEGSEEKRPTVQVGDPFAEKLLLEACLELMATGAVVAIQDMGAAGLTCSAVEMGAKGGLGVRLDLDAVPAREEGMSAYEMMLSESQERMLMVLDPAKEEAARAVFTKWALDFAVVGRTTDDKRFKVYHQGRLMADLPINQLGDEAPQYDRPWVAPAKRPLIDPRDVPAALPNTEALMRLVGSADLCSRRWVWEQYDHLIGGDTVQRPGGDAAVVRLGDGPRALAMCADVTPRYCEADSLEGGRQAVAEAWRNLTAVGAEPLALTDNLNFGSPENPETMGRFALCVRGIGEASRALAFPVVSGNVSLYNETEGRPILPTPTIGGLGLIDDLHRTATTALAREGEALLLVGETRGHLGASLYLHCLLGREEGAPPPVDLDAERRNGDFVRGLIRAGRVSAVHDLSDGGLAVAAAEMALAGGAGLVLDAPGDGVGGGDLPLHAHLFGEDQGRYLIACAPHEAAAIAAEAAAAGVPLARAGTSTAPGPLASLTLPGEPSISLSRLREAHEGWLPTFMGEPVGEPAA